MNLFHVEARPRSRGDGRRKTWLVIAPSAAEALALVPEGQVVLAVEAGSPCKPGPARLVGWMGPPPPLPTAARR